jgi:hypothetical protein
MLNNQAQAVGRERHRLEFFRPDQIIFLVTHVPTSNEPVPDVDLRAWVVNLKSNIDQVAGFADKRAKEFVADLCDQTNDDEHLPEETLKEWSGNLRRELKRRRWKLVNPPPRSYSFPPVNRDEVADVPSEYQQELFPDDAFSIIACNVEEMESDDDTNSSPKKGNKDKEDLEKVNQKRIVTKHNLLTLITDLDAPDSRKNLNTDILTVQAVTPNWIASGGKSDSGGTGGPGGEPRLYKDSDIAAQIPYCFKDLIDKLSNAGSYNSEQGVNLYGDGNGVDVVILDTAPSEDDLVLAYKELVERKETGKEHPIVKNLLETDGLLNIDRATFEERRRMRNTSLNKHGYKMTDHGLFIAGIINSVVPNATIHLIEVLNQFGVGDIESIARGFARAHAIYRKSKRHLVVNCSLCLDLPHLLEEFAYSETDEELIASTEKEFERMLRERMLEEMNQLKKDNPDADEHSLWDDLRWVIELRVMCERLGRIGRQVVAAAGNDSKKKDNGQRHARIARYPAAFTKVLGVGALPKGAGPKANGRYEASSFSNLADNPVINGIMALGGEPGARRGILGLYLGEFPESRREADETTDTETDRINNRIGWAQVPSNNKNGWAWWAGTSFATPILTAVIASVLSGPERPTTTQKALKLLYNAAVIVEFLTGQGEDGIPSSVRQDVNPLLQD